MKVPLTTKSFVFRKAGKIYYFDPAGLELEAGDRVIVKTSRGQELGQVLGLVLVLGRGQHKRQLNSPSLTALVHLTISSSLIYLLMKCYGQPFIYYCESHHPLRYQFVVFELPVGMCHC